MNNKRSVLVWNKSNEIRTLSNEGLAKLLFIPGKSDEERNNDSDD